MMFSIFQTCSYQKNYANKVKYIFYDNQMFLWFDEHVACTAISYLHLLMHTNES